jgi:N,N'-diacetylchitobiose transport system permease protein
VTTQKLGVPQATPPRPARPRKRGGSTPYLLVLPACAILILALGYPLAWQVVTSMQEFGLAQQFGQPPEFVWFANYVTLFTDPYMWTVVARSVAFCLITAGVTMVVGTLLALLMNAVHPMVRITLQISLLLAWAMPVVAAMTVWNWLIDWRRGVLNAVLTGAGLDFQNHNWLAHPLSFFLMAMVIVVWMSVPFVAFAIFAGLTQVSTEVLEAAQLDGAGLAKRLRFIIVPIIRPVLAIILLLQLIWDLRVFTQIRLLQDAGSIASETNLLGTYIYQLGVGSSDFAMASAVSIFVLVLTVALSWFYVRSMLREDDA